MATNEYSSVQVMAARVRLKADQRLKRATPDSIKAIASAKPAAEPAAGRRS